MEPSSFTSFRRVATQTNTACLVPNMIILTLNPRLTKGGCCNPPLLFFSGSSKESYQGHLGNLFYILCGHFHEKKLGVPPYPGEG